MTCLRCQEALSALIDQELSAVELAPIQAHLRTCATCAHACAEMLCIDAAARVVDCPEAPPNLWSRVERALPRGPSERKRPGQPSIVGGAHTRFSRVGRK